MQRNDDSSWLSRRQPAFKRQLRAIGCQQRIRLDGNGLFPRDTLKGLALRGAGDQEEDEKG
jgi:hypothetical protein